MTRSKIARNDGWHRFFSAFSNEELSREETDSSRAARRTQEAAGSKD
jgi:hypothetical protein